MAGKRWTSVDLKTVADFGDISRAGNKIKKDRIRKRDKKIKKIKK